VTILVDRPVWAHASGHRFAHLVSDASREELEAFVARLVLTRPLRFHRDHYDIPDVVWESVVAGGAAIVPTRELVRRLRASGLRRQRAAE
jgi:hypothetical protein